MSKLLAAIIGTFSVLILLLMPVLFAENEKEEFEVERIPQFEDCEEIVSVPIIGIRSFAYCPTDSTVWTGEEWAEPTNFEIRRINKLDKYSSENSFSKKSKTENDEHITVY